MTLMTKISEMMTAGRATADTGDTTSAGAVTAFVTRGEGIAVTNSQPHHKRSLWKIHLITAH